MASRLTTNQEIAGSTPAVVIIFFNFLIQAPHTNCLLHQIREKLWGVQGSAKCELKFITAYKEYCHEGYSILQEIYTYISVSAASDRREDQKQFEEAGISSACILLLTIDYICTGVFLKFGDRSHP
jgi:hypothetical protein